MARKNQNTNKKSIGGRKPRPLFIKRKCALCQQGAIHIDYKNVELLKKFISRTGKILPRRVTGNCNKHQRMVMIAIKRARYIGLLPFIVN